MLDEALLIRFISGEPTAFDSVYKYFYKPVYQNILKIVHDEDEAKDILQDVFVKLLKEKRNFQDFAQMKSWMFRVSYNSSIDYLRFAVKQKLLLSSMSIANAHSNEEQVDGADYQQILRDTIAKLPERKRLAIELCKLQGKTYQEAAEMMNISPHTIKEYVASSVKFIRKNFNKFPRILLYLVQLSNFVLVTI